MMSDNQHGEPSASTKEILLIEDDTKDLPIIITELLERYNPNVYSITQVATLEAAIAALKKNTPACIMLDLRLPDSEGLDTFKKLQQHSGDVPVVILTGNADENIATEVIRLGAQDVLVKGQFDGIRLSCGLRYAQERCRLRDKLRYSSWQIEHVSDAIIGTDLNNAITTWNHGATELYGWSADEAIGRVLSEILSQKSQTYSDEVLSKKMISGESFSDTSVGERRDGTAIVVEKKISPLRNGAGEMIGYISIHRDITERHEMELLVESQRTYLRSIIETAQVIILVLDTKGRIMQYNPYMEKVSGYPLSEMQGKSWFENFLPPMDHERIKEVFQKSLSGTRTKGNINPIVTRSGEQRYIEWYDAPLKSDDGKITGILAIGRDISDSEELQRNARKAEALEVVGKLIGKLSHNFNDLLTVIRGYADAMAAQMKEGDIWHDDIAEVVNATDRARSYILQLLVLSSRYVIAKDPVDVCDTIEDVLTQFRRTAGAKIVIKDKKCKEPAIVQGDRLLIAQAVMNVLDNAVQAVHGAGEISISTTIAQISDDDAPQIAGAYPGDFVRIEISDTGEGIAEDRLTHLFDIFMEENFEDQPGLGLPMVQSIIKQFNGWVNVDSSPGKGATFVLYLPVFAPPKPSKARADEESVAGARILLVEDDDAVRRLMARLLRESKFMVFEARNAAAAEQIFETQKGKFALIICDIVLPDQLGTVLVEKFHQINPESRIILTSGYFENEAQFKKVAQSNYVFLQKPFSINQLITMLMEVMSE